MTNAGYEYDVQHVYGKFKTTSFKKYQIRSVSQICLKMHLIMLIGKGSIHGFIKNIKAELDLYKNRKGKGFSQVNFHHLIKFSGVPVHFERLSWSVSRPIVHKGLTIQYGEVGVGATKGEGWGGGDSSFKFSFTKSMCVCRGGGGGGLNVRTTDFPIL